MLAYNNHQLTVKNLEHLSSLGYAENVIFVPGYGLAVAQAHHQINELANIIQ